MQKIVLSVSAVVAMSSLVFAGGGSKEATPVVEPVVVIPMVEEVGSFYAGLGFSYLSTGASSLDYIDNHPERDRTGNLLFMAGYEFNQYVALEGRYSTYYSRCG